MTNGNNDIEELEELLTELEGQEANLVAPYSEEDDAVTQLMDAPLGDQEWMVQVTAVDRRMMATDQLAEQLRSGKISEQTLVWRGGMDDWRPVSEVDEVRAAASQPAVPTDEMAAAPMFQTPDWSSAAGGGEPAPAELPPPPDEAHGQEDAVSVAPLPPPPAPPVTTNTTRPVAMDFPEAAMSEENGTFPGKKAVLALSATAIIAVVVAGYAFTAGEATPESAAAASQPQSVSSLTPAQPAKESPTSSVAEAEAKPTADEVAKAEAPPEEASEPEPVAEALAVASETSEEEAEEEEEKTTASSTSSSRAARWRARRLARAAARRREARARQASEESSTGGDAPSAPQEQAAVASAASTASSLPEKAPIAKAPSVSTPSSGSQGFDKSAAKAALDQAATQARNCRPEGGPSGSGQVQVVYEPSGKVASATILSEKFKGTTTGGCVRMLFRRARVPEFSGSVVKVNKRFDIP